MIVLTEHQEHELDGAVEDIVERLQSEFCDVMNNIDKTSGMDDEEGTMQEMILMHEYLIKNTIKQLKERTKS